MEKSAASKRGKANRTRGHSFERTTSKMLRENGFPEARRHLEYQKEEANGIDIDNTEPFLIQCKATNNQPNIPKVMKEIKQNNVENIPVVFYKVTGKGTYAAFKVEDALMLMKLFKEIKNKLS